MVKCDHDLADRYAKAMTASMRQVSEYAEPVELLSAMAQLAAIAIEGQPTQIQRDALAKHYETSLAAFRKVHAGCLFAAPGPKN